MEETVWLYFGILAVLIAVGIIASVIMNFNSEGGADKLFHGVEQLGRQARLVCDSPQDTKLSLAVTLPEGAVLYTKTDKLCGRLDNKLKCAPIGCLFVEKTFLNLTGANFGSRQYTCTFMNEQLINVTCQG